MSKATKVLLVLLRIAIGWHFLYEGVWKIASDTGAGQQFTSRYFLQASVGRLRDYFDGPRPTPEAAQARIDQWQDEIIKYFKSQNNPLSEEQLARLRKVRDGLVESAAAKLSGEESETAAFVPTDWYFLHEDVLQLASEKDGRQYFTSEEYLRSAAGPFRGLFRELVSDVDGMDRLTKATAQARIDQRYEDILGHFAAHGRPLSREQTARLAAVGDQLRASAAAMLDDPAFRTRVETYKQLLARVKADARRTTAPFSTERLDADRKRLDAIAAELLAFVNEPMAELAVAAQNIATVEQMEAGPPPRLPEQTRAVDLAIEWGLTAIGLCLMLGFLTPLAAAAAAIQLAIFYLASPPWPGLPASTLGGHYLYVDRNLVEAVAALVIATVPTGKWAGFDFWIYRFATRRRVNTETPVAV